MGDKNVGMYLANSVRTSPVNSARMCRDRRVGTFRNRNAQMCLDRNVAMCRGNSANMCLTFTQLKPMIFRRNQCIYVSNFFHIYGILVNLEALEEINDFMSEK